MPQKPAAAVPGSLHVSERQHVAGLALEPAQIETPETLFLLRSADFGLIRLHVGRKAALLPMIIDGVLMGRKDVAPVQPQKPRNLFDELPRLN